MKRLATVTLVLLCSMALAHCAGEPGDSNETDAGTQSGTDGGSGKDTTDAGSRGGDGGSNAPDSGIPDGLPCDPVSGTGCTAEQKCSIESGPTNQNPNAPFVYGCMDAGTKQEGEACGPTDDCVAGSICMPISPTQAVCATFCYQDSDCPSVGGVALKCTLPVDSANPSGPRLCSPDCNPISNTGCQAGQKCTIVSGPTPQNPNADVVFGCGPAGSKADGDACNDDSECPGQTFCARFSATGSGTCTTFCANDANCPTGSKCLGGIQGYESPLLCREAVDCDPLQQDCPGGQDCFPTQSGNVCAPSNNVDEGQACSAANDCKPGLMCIGNPAGGGASCRKICNLTAGQEPSCSTGTCQGLQGVSGFGVCG